MFKPFLGKMKFNTFRSTVLTNRQSHTLAFSGSKLPNMCWNNFEFQATRQHLLGEMCYLSWQNCSQNCVSKLFGVSTNFKTISIFPGNKNALPSKTVLPPRHNFGAPHRVLTLFCYDFKQVFISQQFVAFAKFKTYF